MRCFALAVVLGALTLGAPGQVVINECVYDDTSVDNREFVELYNAGAAPVAIGGYVIENRDAGGLAAGNPITIPAGTTLAPGAFWVIGNAAVPNLNQVAPANFLENDNEAVILKAPGGTVVDVLGYEVQGTVSGALPATLYEGAGLTGNFQSIDGLFGSIGRFSDGVDTNDNGADFGHLVASPGAPNVQPALTAAWCSDFEDVLGDRDAPGWAGTFARPRVVDPTLVGPNVVNVVPASPDGGRCMTVWDPAGGGNAVYFRSAPSSDQVIEAWVYLFVGHVPGDQEQWSIGVAGSSDTFHNFPFPASTLNANTGVAWEYVTDGTGGTLRLVDEKSGGATQTTLATIAITPGVNDGWQRIRLAVNGAAVSANFGGTFGNPASGQLVTGTLSAARVGNVYAGYREAAPATGVANARSLLLDRVEIGSAALASCPTRFQTNQPGAGLTLDLVAGGRFTRAVTPACAGATVTLDVRSTALGLPFDIGIVGGALAANPGLAIPVPGSQLVNLDLVTPALLRLWLFGGAGPDLATTAFPGPFGLPFTMPAGPVLLSTQMVVIDPANAVGFSLSQGCELQSAPAVPTILGPTVEDGEVVVDITRPPFCSPPMPFYGVPQSILRLQSNGRVVFGAANPNNTSFSPGTAAALANNPFLGVWADFSPTSPSPIVLSRPGVLRISYTAIPYWDTGLSSTFAIELDPLLGNCRITGIAGIAATLGQTMWIGASPGFPIATDLGATAFGPAPNLGITSTPGQMLYTTGTAGPIAGVGSIDFLPNGSGNYDWIANP